MMIIINGTAREAEVLVGGLERSALYTSDSEAEKPQGRANYWVIMTSVYGWYWGLGIWDG